MKNLLQTRRVRYAISALIFINAVVMGLQTIGGLSCGARFILSVADWGCLTVFVVEMALKLFAFRKDFFRDPWNCFDFTVVLISLLPQLGVFSTVRIFRSLRVFRVISGTRHLRMIVVSIVSALPGVGWTAFLLTLIYYVYAIFGVNLFGQEFPELFGSVQNAFFTLFQMMTLDDWCSGVAMPILKAHPMSWIYFVSFVLISAFVVMNVVIGIFVNSMGEAGKKIGSQEEEKKKIAIEEINGRLLHIEKMLECAKTKLGE